MTKNVMEKLLAGKSDQIVLFKAGQMAKGVVVDVTSHRILVSLPGGQTGIVTKKEASGFGVEVGDVEIGSNTSIDRAVFGTTLIEKGARLDNLIQVAHNCVFGKGSVAAAQSGFAGSTIIGQNNVFGAQSGAAGHLSIAPFNRFAARTGVTKSVKESGKTFAGFPFMDHKTWLKIQGKLARLIK